MRRILNALRSNKAVLLIALMCCQMLVFAQSDSAAADKNKSKINELNQRLDNLVKSTSTVSNGDSVEYKLDLLLKQMKEVKQEITAIKADVNTIKEENRAARIEGETAATNEIVGGSYYVVIGSRRDDNLAKSLLAELSITQEVKLVKNSKNTWNHIVLSTPFSNQDAAKKVYELRKGTFKDAWWTISKRLTMK